MTRAFARRATFVVAIAIVLGVAATGTLLGRRSFADYSRARGAIRGEIARYERVLRTGESRVRAVAALRAAGAPVNSSDGDIVITVLRELSSSSQCRSLVGQLDVRVSAAGRVTSWETRPLNAECNANGAKQR